MSSDVRSDLVIVNIILSQNQHHPKSWHLIIIKSTNCFVISFKFVEKDLIIVLLKSDKNSSIDSIDIKAELTLQEKLDLNFKIENRDYCSGCIRLLQRRFRY